MKNIMARVVKVSRYIDRLIVNGLTWKIYEKIDTTDTKQFHHDALERNGHGG
jgi:hypothetical protein